MNRPLEFAAVVLAAGIVGCASRAHLTESQGQAYAAAFAQQGPPPKGQIRGPVSGLDSQEAAIISETYRRGLAPKNVPVKEEPILIVAPPSRGAGGYGALAPSVPKER